MKQTRFKIIWAIVLLFGFIAVCTLGASPTEIILFAQAANAFLLPITAILLLIVCNDKKFMDGQHNSTLINVLGFIVIAVTILIAIRNFSAFSASLRALLG